MDKKNLVTKKLPGNLKVTKTVYISSNKLLTTKIRGLIKMSEVINFLKENSLIYLATSGLDGNAKVRPILFYFEEDG